ncbi:MAG: anthranilate phosphoribosyltransferase [Verrucomicrobiota bacterium]
MNPASSNFTDLTARLESGVSLTPPEVELAADYLLSEEGDADLKADFLRSLAKKGETVEEIAGFVQAFLRRAVDPGLVPEAMPGPMIDVCGTGGDRLDLFNVSTTSMFVLAAGGARVVKHGNRSVTSQCGGADVLETLGIRIDLPPPELRRCVETHGCGFLFAPHYHPAFRVIAPVRKALAGEGIATIFNLLGPLLNPARPGHQLVGIFSEAALPKYAGVLQRLGRRHAWAVHGCASNGAGMDEISTMGATQVHAVQRGAFQSSVLDLELLKGLGLSPATLADLRGGTREDNAAILLGILDGSIQGPKREKVALNAAAGFVVADLAESLEAGLALALEQLDSGKALAKLRALQGFR